MYSNSYDTSCDSGYLESRDIIEFELSPRFRERSKSAVKWESRNRPKNRRYSESDFSDHPPSCKFPSQEVDDFKRGNCSSSSGSECDQNIQIVPNRYRGEIVARPVPRIKRFKDLKLTNLYSSVDNLNCVREFRVGRSVKFSSEAQKPTKTVSVSTQTPPLEQVLLEMRMERDMRAESGDEKWISVYEKEGDPDWRQLGREMRYLADDWREYSQEIEDLGRTSSEKSIWRSILETILYLKPKALTPSLNRKSVSMFNLPTEPLPRSDQAVHSRSLSSSQTNFIQNRSRFDSSGEKSCSNCSISVGSYSSFERNLNDPLENDMPGSRRHSFSTQRPQRHRTSTERENGNCSSELRRRSRSFSATGNGSTSRREVHFENDEIDLDPYLSTPYNEQWNKKHYECETFEKPQLNLRLKKKHLGPVGKMNWLEIPKKCTLSDDDDITPEAKYLGMTNNDNMFKRNDNYKMHQ
ncbi:uncharacterized protein LOC143912356 [Arctopsyche grandis]|uniref:uncharacterized protein LOC143912356 n=1 Tax=Arctopsyche grandis TaxID=121162 RepID=UPI00406D854A